MKIKERPYIVCLLVFAVCAAARIFEYYVLRTDRTVLAENIFHKLFGIAVLLITLRLLGMKPKDIGFKAPVIKPLAAGLALGLGCFTIACTAEMCILLSQGKTPSLDFYAAGFSLDGGETAQRSAGFILLCLLFNVVNVVMEEGVFRGLYLGLTEPASGFAKANLFAALLFGVWHWVMPMRSFTDGESTLGNMLVMGIAYVILAGMMSIKWGMLYKMTGCLWAGLGDHFFNNAIATNLLHVVAGGEADSLQTVRVIIAQLLSFAIVAFIYARRKKRGGRSDISKS